MRMLGWPLVPLLGLAGVAHAQAGPSPGEQPPVRRTRVFIAPSGKPWRVPPDADPVAVWFAAADRNHDGKIDQGEFRADFAAFFDELDVDRDGRIGPEELIRYEREVAPEVQTGGGGFGGHRGGAMGSGGRRGGGRPGGGGMGGGGEDMDGARDGGRRVVEGPRGGGRFGLIDIPEPIAAMDADLNGYVTRDEMVAAADRRFRLLDAANTGELTLASLPKLPGSARAPRGRGRKRG